MGSDTRDVLSFEVGACVGWWLFKLGSAPHHGVYRTRFDLIELETIDLFDECDALNLRYPLKHIPSVLADDDVCACGSPPPGFLLIE